MKRRQEKVIGKRWEGLRKPPVEKAESSFYEMQKQRGITRWKVRRCVTYACWSIFLAAFLWSVYKNFTAIDTVTVKETEVVKEVVEDTTGIGSFVEEFALLYYSCPKDAPDQIARQEALQGFLVDFLMANLSVNDGEAVSVSDVKIWDIRKMGKGSYEVDLTVDQKKGDAIARGAYSVNVYREGDSYVIASLPRVAAPPDKASYEPEQIGQAVQVKAEVRDGVKEFLETFFRVYPTATREELRYYFKEKDPRVVGRSLSLEKVSDIAIEEAEDGKSLKASCIVSYSNEETGLKEAGSYVLTLEKVEDRYRILEIR